MLKKETLIAKLGKDYEPMINKISIPDFTKCIAQYSGIYIQDLKDEIIELYLTDWAINKKYIFDLFGDTRVDLPIHYIDEDIKSRDKIMEIAKEFPIYYLWLNMFKRIENNKIDFAKLDYDDRDMIKSIFPDKKIDGSNLTHFLKKMLLAPDDMITKIAAIWENAEMDATFTLSIDPVDIMLSSENPYKWTSCYRLETPMSESHADGCLAGVLDCSTIITYIWNNQGDFTLYDKYKFKNIRYKRIRMTIAVNKNFTAIHFNEIYPGKSNLSDNFHKLLRDKVETYLAEKNNYNNVWEKLKYDKSWRLSPERFHAEYGYNEYGSNNVWGLKDAENMPKFGIYNSIIYCPCGCGEPYFGTSYTDDKEYDGEGHINENYYDRGIYCDYTDEYEDCDGDCRNCSVYRREHMVCELDEDEPCDRNAWDAEDEGDFDPYDSPIVHCNPEHCADCPLYKLHHPEEFEEEENEIQPTEIPNNIKEGIEETIKNRYTISLPSTTISTTSANEIVSLDNYRNFIATAELDNVNLENSFLSGVTCTFDMDKLTKDFIFNKILNHQYFTYEEFVHVVDHVQDDLARPWCNEYILSNGNKTARISIAVPKDITNNYEFIHYIYTNLGIMETPDQTNVEARSE